MLIAEWAEGPLCPSSAARGLEHPVRIRKSCHRGGAAGRGYAGTWDGGGASASLSVPKGALPGLRGSNFLCNPTPLVVLILRNKREAELFKFKWGFPWVEVLLTLRAKMGSTWGHRWVEALCAWLVRFGQSSVAFYKTVWGEYVDNVSETSRHWNWGTDYSRRSFSVYFF